MFQRRLRSAVVCWFLMLQGVANATPVADCRGTLYLTLDTGTMRDAEWIAQMLTRQGVRSTFFLANEATPQGDSALDDRWAPFWRALAAQGHAFGSHTWRHGRFMGDRPEPSRAVDYRPQFGEQAGQRVTLEPAQVCQEIERVDERFRALTGQSLGRWWRAPGGFLTAHAQAAARACGWYHVAWSEAGFLGDELPSDRFPNADLLARALARIRDGDILMAHLGIRSRRDPFAPMLEPMITGLKSRGFCFATLPPPEALERRR
jgi:hypothetical protein